MDIFTALADPTRRHILELLADRGGLSSTTITKEFKISPPAISQHLKVLREVGIVEVEKRAQQRIYTVNPAGLDQLEEWTRRMKKHWEGRFRRLDNLLNIDKNKKGGGRNE